ncbi:DUF58 domain-containing protein [Kineococcus sp. SYSU DK004]|uniref:DUF58 domain-containing protein n=1 Tax=Kineococcus sp. SYSU DK004 TaxID=3383125 RepID=UPI003D7DD4A9
MLLLALVTLGTVAAHRGAGSLDLESRSRDLVVEAGSPAPVRLAVTVRRRAHAARVVVEDAAPVLLGGGARLGVPPREPGRTVPLEHVVTSEVRGSFRLGPAAVRSGDLFGLARSRRRLGEAVAIDVLPRVHRLAELTLGDVGGSRGSSASAASTSSPDDASIREYRVGDDLRRVHWRSTARRGTVMVRSDEHPGHPDAVLLLDDRAGAHRGPGPASSLEHAVSTAASAAVHLHRRGHRVRLLHAGALERVREADEPSAVRHLLRSLARLRPAREDSLARSVRALGRSESTLLVAVLGDVDERDVQPLLSARPLGAPALAVLLRTRTWAGTGSDDPDADRRLDRARLVLARAGWRTAVAEAGERVPDVWARLARSGPVARRAAAPGAPGGPGPAGGGATIEGEADAAGTPPSPRPAGRPSDRPSGRPPSEVP